MTLLLLLSRETTLLLFRLVRFDSHLFSTLLNTVFTISVSTPLQSVTIQLYGVVLEFQSHAYFFHCCLLLLRSQQHFLLSMFPFCRQVGFTYSLTLTCSMLHAVLFPCIHLVLILILFLHLLCLGKVSCGYCFDLTSLLTVCFNSFSSLY